MGPAWILTLCLAFLCVTNVLGLIRELPDIRCYRCNGTDPECDWDTETIDCEEPFDMCVTIIERKGDYVHYTQDCLSSIDDYRKDLPLFRGRGCRPAKRVSSAIIADGRSNITYDDVTYCFCRYSDECNNGGRGHPQTTSWISVFLLVVVLLRKEIFLPAM